MERFPESSTAQSICEEKEGANLCREMFICYVLEFSPILDLYETSLLTEIDSPYPRPGKITASISPQRGNKRLLNRNQGLSGYLPGMVLRIILHLRRA